MFEQTDELSGHRDEKQKRTRVYVMIGRAVVVIAILGIVGGYFWWRERTVLVREWAAASMEAGFHWKYEGSRWERINNWFGLEYSLHYATDSDVTYLKLEAPFSDADVARLSRCPNLETLFLEGKEFTGESLTTLRDLNCPIKTLVFRGGPVADEQFAALADLRQLESLAFRSQGFEGESLRHLAKFKRLENFALESPIEVDNFHWILRTPSLKEFGFPAYGRRFTDAEREKVQLFEKSTKHLKRLNQFDYGWD